MVQPSRLEYSLQVFLQCCDLFRLATKELTIGAVRGTLPWNRCLAWGCATGFATWFCLYKSLASATKIPQLEIFVLNNNTITICMMFSGFIFWSAAQVVKRYRLSRRVGEVLETAKLRTTRGLLPKFVGDEPIDSHTRRMRLTREGLPVAAFEKAKHSLASGFQVYIDEIKENREAGTVDILYCDKPMPSEVAYSELALRDDCSFTVGSTRSKMLVESLRSVPHLLIAGQTGGGKSTFLRQFITTLRYRNPQARFVLVDLKGGLEFQVFEKLKGVQVAGDVETASRAITDLDHQFEDRFRLLKASNCKDIDDYNKKIRKKEAPTDQNQLHRIIVVVDEAAELFLANPTTSTADVQKARRVVNRVAAQGRAIGMHLVIATQRPDVKSLDPQTKANLPGVLSFAMTNSASSMTVLGCGRAKDLPKIAGRAIWKTAGEMVEVQTPLLPIEGVETYIANLRQNHHSACQPMVQLAANDTKRSATGERTYGKFSAKQG
jgi:hypothetical protein